MSRFLMTVWPLTGHVHPNLAIASALRERGHEVAFYTGDSQRRTVEHAGFRCFPLQSVDERLIERLVLSEAGILSARRKPWRFKALWRSWVLDTVPAQVEDIERVMGKWAPDVLVCDPTMWAPFLVIGERHQIPVAVFSLVPACHLSGPQGPILGFPVPPPRNALERAGTRALRVLSDIALADVRRAARQLRGQYGLPSFRGSVTDAGGRVPLYLVPGSPEFDYARTDLPASVHYVGPCIWDASHGTTTPAGPAFVRQHPEWPLVYVSEGTVNLKPRVLKAAAQGLGHLPVEVVLSTGRHRDPDALDLGPRPLAPNIRIEQWVDYAALLSHLSALVTIGGPSTLLPALQRGIPVVVVPSDWDHPETAWRVHVSGAGVRLTPRRCTAERMRAAVTRVLSDPACKANADRVAAELQRCGGPGRAARLLESLVTIERATADARRSESAVSHALVASPEALAAGTRGMN